MSYQETPVSARYNDKHVLFTVSADGDSPSFTIRSEAKIQARVALPPPTAPPTHEPTTLEVHATPEDVNKAIFLTDEARKGKTLIVKVTDAEKFRSRIVPEELCVNMKEKRLEVTPKFFWDVYNEYTDPSWHCWVCVCSSRYKAKNTVMKIKLPFKFGAAKPTPSSTAPSTTPTSSSTFATPLPPSSLVSPERTPQYVHTSGSTTPLASAASSPYLAAATGMESPVSLSSLASSAHTAAGADGGAGGAGTMTSDGALKGSDGAGQVDRGGKAPVSGAGGVEGSEGGKEDEEGVTVASSLGLSVESRGFTRLHSENEPARARAYASGLNSGSGTGTGAVAATGTGTGASARLPDHSLSRGKYRYDADAYYREFLASHPSHLEEMDKLREREKAEREKWERESLNRNGNIPAGTTSSTSTSSSFSSSSSSSSSSSTPTSLATAPDDFAYTVVDSRDFNLAPDDHICGVIILQQFVYDSDYFEWGPPLATACSPPDVSTGSFNDVGEVSIFCAKSCGGKLLTALVDHVYHHLPQYKYLVASSTNTAQIWYRKHAFKPVSAFRLDPRTIDLKKMSKRQRARAEHLYRHRMPDEKALLDEPSHMLYVDVKEDGLRLQLERQRDPRTIMGSWLAASFGGPDGKIDGRRLRGRPRIHPLPQALPPPASALAQQRAAYPYQSLSQGTYAATYGAAGYPAPQTGMSTGQLGGASGVYPGSSPASAAYTARGEGVAFTQPGQAAFPPQYHPQQPQQHPYQQQQYHASHQPPQHSQLTQQHAPSHTQQYRQDQAGYTHSQYTQQHPPHAPQQSYQYSQQHPQQQQLQHQHQQQQQHAYPTYTAHNQPSQAYTHTHAQAHTQGHGLQSHSSVDNSPRPSDQVPPGNGAGVGASQPYPGTGAMNVAAAHEAVMAAQAQAQAQRQQQQQQQQNQQHHYQQQQQQQQHAAAATSSTSSSLTAEQQLRYLYNLYQPRLTEGQMRYLSQLSQEQQLQQLMQVHVQQQRAQQQQQQQHQQQHQPLQPPQPQQQSSTQEWRRPP